VPEWNAEIARHLAALRLRPEREREIVDELAMHLEDRYCEALGRGASQDEARAVALAELGDVLVPELQRVEDRWSPPATLGAAAPRGARWIDTLLQDARYALRSLRLNPGFTAVALLTLALGIGACALILSAVNAVWLRPLPYREPERLAMFWGTAPEKGLPEVNFPEGLVAVNRDRTRVLENLAGFSGGAGFTLTGSGDAERVEGAVVSSDFFRVLGVSPLLGRVPAVDEAVRNAPARVVVLSHALWMRRFGGDTGLVGRTIDLSGSPATVIGVMPARFAFPARSELWAPLALDPTAMSCWCYDMIGRMRPGITPDDVAREIATITDDYRISRNDPDAKRGGSRIIAKSLSDRLVGSIQKQLVVLLIGVGCLLLVACANIANLLLARTAARGRELAVRCCLGASPRRVASQLLTESVILSLAGAALGGGLAAVGARMLRQLPTTQFPRIDEVRLDPLVLAVTAAVAMITGMLCGLLPAWRASRVDLQDAMKSGAKGSGSRASRRASDAFVVAQFALSLLLLAGAGLLVRSYHRLAGVETGYRADHVLTARMQLPYPRYDSAHVVRALYGRLLERAAALPGVRAIGTASRIPLAPGNPQDNIEAEGKEARPGELVRVANIRMVSPGYFAAIGTPLVRGRLFTPADDDRATRVAVLDELFAKHFWPGQDPIGKRFKHGGDTTSGRWLTVIGVVANVKHTKLDETGDLQVYEAFAQRTTWTNYLVVRTDGDGENGLISELRRAVSSVDPTVPLFEVRTMRAAIDLSLGTRRLTNVLLTGFSLIALLVAAVGIYGVISLGVTGRTREFGIRLALGARPQGVRALVLRQAMRMAGIGVAIGLAAAVATTRYLRTLLFEVDPLDTMTLGAVAGMLTVTALLASYLPARRATEADPLVALKAE